MKKISIIVSVVAFTILLVAVVVILNFTKGDVRVNVLEKQTSVGLLLSCEKDDNGWCESHYKALTDLSEELNLSVVCRENIRSDKNCISDIRSLIEKDGCSVIIGALLSDEPYLAQAAEEFPDTYFIQIGGDVSGRNLCSFMGRTYQFRYLSGIVAGNQTKTGSIGYVAVSPGPDEIRDINAFTLGVRRMNPDAVVHVRYCDSRTDDSLAERAAERLIADKDVDVMTMDTDSLAPLKSAQKHGIWSIGCNSDNSQMFPSSYLTGCVWNWKSAYRDRILEYLRGKPFEDSEWLGYESGITELVEPSKTGIARRGYEVELESARRSFEDHSFDVFYGPITDSDHNIRVAEGESMSDMNIKNSFDWYVEGVEVE